MGDADAHCLCSRSYQCILKCCLQISLPLNQTAAYFRVDMYDLNERLPHQYIDTELSPFWHIQKSIIFRNVPRLPCRARTISVVPFL